MLVPIMNTAAMIASVILDDTAFGYDNFPIGALNIFPATLIVSLKAGRRR